MASPSPVLAVDGLSVRYAGTAALRAVSLRVGILAENVVYLERAPWTVLAPALGLVLLGVAASLLRSPATGWT